jgi:CDP-glucose 4,6-dehydratase
MFGGFFNKKRVLVTGVAGVKGTWLALFLLEAGADVLGIDTQLPSPESNFVCSGLAGRITFLHGDICDLDLMLDLIRHVDCIFNLAAEVLVRVAFRKPLATYRSNTFGVATILEALRLSDSPKLAVFITTDKVYKSKNGDLWIEEDPLGAEGPYPVSKACAELIIADYHKSYFQTGGIRIAVARAGNVVIGGDLYSSSRTDGAGRIFVDCFEALIAGRSPEIFSPGFTRPYTYGLDIISGYMTLMSRLDSQGVHGEAFNFGPYEFGVSNAVLATKICELWGADVMWQTGTSRPEPFEHQSLSFAKSQTRLGWRPAFTLYEALSAAARWYKEWAGHQDSLAEGCMADFNDGLLREYRDAARRLGIGWAAGYAAASEQ